MKRIHVLLVSVSLAAGSMATAEASSKRVERTVESRYGAYPAPVTGCNAPLGSFACLIVKTRPHEAFFTAEVTDAHGQPVFVEMLSDDGRSAVFCGETTKPIPVSPGTELSFHIGMSNWGVTTDCPANRVKTTGTIRVTLTNRR